MAKRMSEEEKIRKMKLRVLLKKEEELHYNRNEEDRKVKCPVCGKQITEKTIDDVEYVKTKRGTEILVHTKCVGKWGK